MCGSPGIRQDSRSSNSKSAGMPKIQSVDWMDGPFAGAASEWKCPTEWASLAKGVAALLAGADHSTPRTSAMNVASEATTPGTAPATAAEAAAVVEVVAAAAAADAGAGPTLDPALAAAVAAADLVLHPDLALAAAPGLARSGVLPSTGGAVAPAVLSPRAADQIQQFRNTLTWEFTKLDHHWDNLPAGELGPLSPMACWPEHQFQFANQFRPEFLGFNPTPGGLFITSARHLHTELSSKAADFSSAVER